MLLAHEFCTASQEELTSDISYAFLKGRKYIEIPDDIILCYMNSVEASFKAQWDYVGNAHFGLNYHGAPCGGSWRDVLRSNHPYGPMILCHSPFREIRYSPHPRHRFHIRRRVPSVRFQGMGTW